MKKTVFILTLVFLASVTAFAQGSKTAAPQKARIVEITTRFGTMKIKLYNETPKHRDNFIKLASEGFYTDLLFHRVIKEFMVQGGDPKSKNATPDAMLGSGDVGYKVPAEFNPALYHKKGALAAARDGNPEMASSGCQFYIVQGRKYTNEELSAFESRMGIKYSPQQRSDYINIGGTPHLDQGYTVFGEVIEGIEVLDKLATVQTKSNDRPVEDLKFSVKVLK